MPEHGNSVAPRDWLDEMKVTFDTDEMSSFFDRFAPLDSPPDLFERPSSDSGPQALSDHEP